MPLGFAHNAGPGHQCDDVLCSGLGIITLSQSWVILHQRWNKTPRIPHPTPPPPLLMLSHSVSSIPRHWLRQLSTHSAHHYKTPSCELWPVTHSDEILLDSDPVIWHFIWLCVSTTNWFSLPSITPSRFSWLTAWPRIELIMELHDMSPVTEPPEDPWSFLMIRLWIRVSSWVQLSPTSL